VESPIPFARGAPVRLKLELIIVGLGLFLSACGQAAAVGPSTAAPTVTASTSASAVLAATALPSPVASTSMSIQGFAFHPSVITVPVGSKVTWSNLDLDDHTITANGGTFNSDDIASGQTFSFTFTKAGPYDYHCQIHPYMQGRVVVTAH
jgi:plastocyanin